jgi:hypothetical protein
MKNGRNIVFRQVRKVEELQKRSMQKIGLFKMEEIQDAVRLWGYFNNIRIEVWL